MKQGIHEIYTYNFNGPSTKQCILNALYEKISNLVNPKLVLSSQLRNLQSSMVFFNYQYCHIEYKEHFVADIKYKKGNVKINVSQKAN